MIIQYKIMAGMITLATCGMLKEYIFFNIYVKYNLSSCSCIEYLYS